ncbi:putative m serotype precursor [Phaeomoniella chlamydospora]|uniref:Putative m serotype n=1 Tax=Phaeomoniella chlamydospora TaxID=158046 RepID=A0A0G2H6N9_PHACM|nr:putative m serotype precursor [Phaeomoniella chlamydospora]
MSVSEDDLRAETAQLVEDLKAQLQRAEAASDQYRKQLDLLQSRLDETTHEHLALEEKLHEQDGKIESLKLEVKAHIKEKRDIEQSIEAERAMMAKDKEQHNAKEEALQAIIQRLNEGLKQREVPRAISRSSSFRNRASASPEIDNGQFAPNNGLERSPSRNNSKLLLQKDKMIESLRLELAESQIKLAEIEHMGDGRLQDLEKALLETRMANARLMEDNESFQLLLSEKTLKGDFMHESHAHAETSTGLGSLADELESVDETSEKHPETEDTKKLEAQVKAARDENKALTLYIDRIIGRLLQHDGFEHIIHDQMETPDVPGKASLADKELPPPPPPKESGPSLLQRARSVVSGQGRPPAKGARPVSYMPTRSDTLPTAHENPETAPSIPLGRSTSVRTGHRRTRSDQAQIDAVAPAVVGQMFRGSPMRSTSNHSTGPLSPRLGPMSPGLNSPRQSFFGPSAVQSNKSVSGQGISASDRAGSSSNSITSDHSGDVDSSSAPSPPRSNQGMNNYTGAVMKQSQLRPLRLVQENREMESGDQGGSMRNADADEAARKKANRGSWVAGWFNRGSADQPAQ